MRSISVAVPTLNGGRDFARLSRHLQQIRRRLAVEVLALHAHRYTGRGLFRRTFLVGQALRIAGMDRGTTFPESIAFLLGEIGYFVRQGHTHRIPQLLVYESVRWLGFQVGRRAPLGASA